MLTAAKASEQVDLAAAARRLGAPEAGSHVPAWLPASWWIADRYGDSDWTGTPDPSVWAPRPGSPRMVISRSLAGPDLWAVLARALPDRGTCLRCTAVACPEHGGGR